MIRSWAGKWAMSTRSGSHGQWFTIGPVGSTETMHLNYYIRVVHFYSEQVFIDVHS